MRVSSYIIGILIIFVSHSAFSQDKKEGKLRVRVDRVTLTGRTEPYYWITIRDDIIKTNIYFDTYDDLQDFINSIEDANIEANFGVEE